MKNVTTLSPVQLSLTDRRVKERYGVTVAPKKRQHSDEKNPVVKRHKKTIEVDSTSEAKSTTVEASLLKTVSESKQETKPDLRNLIAKAQQKIQEKRQNNHPCSEITRQRIAARLALNQVVATVEFDDHMKFHSELEQLGCTFIHDQVDCLNMFKFLPRSDYNDESVDSVIRDKASVKAQQV